MGKNLRIKAARAALDMTQKGLADTVGVTRQTMNAIEMGDITRRSVCASRSVMHLVRH